MANVMSNSANTASRTIATGLVLCLLFIGLLSVVQHFAVQTGLIHLSESDGFARQFLRYRDHSTIEFWHLVPGFIFFLIAPVQFVGAIRRRYPLIHRLLGRTYVTLGLLSAVMGTIIAIVFPFGGRLVSTCCLP